VSRARSSGKDGERCACTADAGSRTPSLLAGRPTDPLRSDVRAPLHGEAPDEHSRHRSGPDPARHGPGPDLPAQHPRPGHVPRPARRRGRLARPPSARRRSHPHPRPGGDVQPRHHRHGAGARRSPDPAPRGAVRQRRRRPARRRVLPGARPGRVRRRQVAPLRVPRGGGRHPLRAVDLGHQRALRPPHRAEPLRRRTGRVRLDVDRHRRALRDPGRRTPLRRRPRRPPECRRGLARRHRAGQGHPDGALRARRRRGLRDAGEVLPGHQHEARRRRPQWLVDDAKRRRAERATPEA
jgi:hypothetical protein